MAADGAFGDAVMLRLSVVGQSSHYVTVANMRAEVAAITGPLRLQICGNGVQEAGEQCDDGNQLPGDGCSATCQFQ